MSTLLDRRVPGDARSESWLPDAVAEMGVDVGGDGASDGPSDMLPDVAPDVWTPSSTILTNPALDPLNSGAAGSLTWNACDSSFSGEVVLEGLAAGEVYQLKLEQDWDIDHQAGRSVSALGRTWDATIWELGDVDSLLPSPHTGAGPGDEPASNIGDYLTVAEQEALYAAGHELFGYLIFAFFTTQSTDLGDFTEDDQHAAVPVSAQADGFHLAFFADFSWHTSAAKEEGFITFPADQYTVRFVVTRESGSWPDVLLAEGVTFDVGTCP